jgi:hypothetical protein
MTEKNKKNNKISEILVKDELRPIERMLSEYRREMEEIKRALGDSPPAENKTPKKTLKKK